MVDQQYSYPDVATIVEKHDHEVIEKSGGSLGVIDQGLLESCLHFIQNHLYYDTFEDKITHLVFSIAKNHAFVDGNKRTAIVAGAYFLEINSFDQYIIDVFIREMENVVLLTVRNIITKNELKQIISDLINNAELSDETKLIYARKLDDNSLKA